MTDDAKRDGVGGSSFVNTSLTTTTAETHVYSGMDVFTLCCNVTLVSNNN